MDVGVEALAGKGSGAVGVTKFEPGDVVMFKSGEGPKYWVGVELPVKGTSINDVGEEFVHLGPDAGDAWFTSRFELVRRAKDAKQMPSDWEVGDRLEYIGPGGDGLFPGTFYLLMHPNGFSDEVVVRGEYDRRVYQRPPNLFKNLTAAERAAKGALVGGDRMRDAIDAMAYAAAGLEGNESQTIRQAVESGRLKLHPIQKHFLEGLRGQKATSVFVDEPRETPSTATAARIFAEYKEKVMSMTPEETYPLKPCIKPVPVPTPRCGACNAKLPTAPLGSFKTLDTSKPLGSFTFPCANLADPLSRGESMHLCKECGTSVAQHIAYLKTKNDGFDPDVD